MANQPVLERASSLVEQSGGGADVLDQPVPLARQIGYWPLGVPFPVLLKPGQLMRVFGIKHARFAILQKQGRFRFLEAHPHVSAAIYSGRKVADYCEGRSDFGFGRKR